MRSEVATAMDFLPTFARLAGSEPPADRVVDGRDIRSILLQREGPPVHEAFFYYREHELQAVRAGRWKLHLREGELYDLEADIGESTDVAAQHPDVLAAMAERAQRCRADLGDALTGTVGANCRPAGRVDDPQPLTRHDPSHPYIVAMYD